jgi:hypothetical protein
MFTSNLDSLLAISSFTSIIGEMSVTGLQRMMPKGEHGCRLNGAVKLSNKLQVYISTNKLCFHVHACKHIIGENIKNDWLRTQLSSQPVVQADVRQLCINSMFDYNNGTYKLVDATEQEGIHAVWQARGEEVLFEAINEVVFLVNQR